MTATPINGRGIADAILVNLAEQISALHEPLHLAALCVGDDEGLKSFVQLKQKAAQKIGVIFSSYFFDANDEQGVIQTLKYLAADPAVHGIFIELPLPKTWNTDELISLIPPEKDVDAFSGTSLVLEPTVVALEYVLREYDWDVKGKPVCVVGQGRLVGRPITRWLQEQGAQVTVIDAHTAHPHEIARQADLLITGVGKSGLVTGEWVKDGAMVIDFGFPGGDVDQDSVSKKAHLFTPVPGGMGPLLIAAVLENLIALATNS